jgi:cellobiose phosphorylase
LQALARLGEGDRAGHLISLLNPVQHARTREDAFRYRVEPYVVAADVYSGAGHDGRGGWTWYTGAAGWMYRIVLESMLGLARRNDHLTMSPCVPRAWNGFEIEYRYLKSVYVIRVENPQGVMSGVRKLEVDGKIVTDGRIALDGGGGRHEVRVLMGGDTDQRSASVFPGATASALEDHRRAPG